MPTLRVRLLDGSNIILNNIQLDISVAQLKQRIADQQGTPPIQQRLIYGGQYLDDQRSLDHYNISDGFLISLLISAHSPPAIPQAHGADTKAPLLRNVFIKPASGPVVTIQDVPADATIERLKQMYYFRTDQPPDQVRMIYGGKELEESRNGRLMTLRDYHISEESTLHVAFRMPGGRFTY